MFSFLKPRCPITLAEQSWVETAMQWLADQFGPARLLDATVVSPTEEFFPEAYGGTLADARNLMERLGDYFQVDVRQVELVACGGTTQASCSVANKPHAISVPEHQLDNPEFITAAVLNGLARKLLVSEVQLAPDDARIHWLADLLPVYSGLGIFMANAVMQLHSEPMEMGGAHLVRRPGHLPANVASYALALFAWVRGETHPEWKSHLRPDAAAVLRRGLRYLRRTGHSVFDAESIDAPKRSLATDELVRWLKTGHGSARLAALWALQDPRHAEPALEHVMACLRDRIQVIRCEAAMTLACYGSVAEPAMPILRDLLEDRDAPVRSAAVTALGKLGLQAEQTLPELVSLLEDPSRQVVHAASTAIARFGGEGQLAISALLPRLKDALVNCDLELTTTLAKTIFEVDPDPTDRLVAYFEDDYDLQHQAVHLIAEAITHEPDEEDTDPRGVSV